MSSGYPPPPPPQPKPTPADHWNRLKLWQKIAIPVGAALTLALLISALFSSDPEPTNEAKGEPTSQAPTKEDPTEPAYEFVDQTDTGLGNEVTVSVEKNEATDEVFQAALEEYDAFSVTIVCAGQEDVEKTGYILFGNRDDGIVDSDKRAC